MCGPKTTTSNPPRDNNGRGEASGDKIIPEKAVKSRVSLTNSSHLLVDSAPRVQRTAMVQDGTQLRKFGKVTKRKNQGSDALECHRFTEAV